MAVHSGSWLGLPDFGITEKVGSWLGAPRTSQGGSDIFRTNQAAPQQMYKSANYNTQVPYGPTYSGPVTKNVNTGGGGGSSGGQSQPNFDFSSNIQSPGEPFGGGPSEVDLINQEFENFNNYLNQQETQAQTNFNETKGLADTQKASAEKQYSTEKATQTEDIKKNESLNLRKVRELLGEISQGNAGYTAIHGGGSVSEVLAERFGREAQSRMGNVMDTAQQGIRRVNEFYNNAITTLQEKYESFIMDARQGLTENLNQIRYQKQASATAKQQAQMSAWRDYYNSVNQAKIQAAQFKAQYDIWKQERDSELAATSGFSLANANTINQQNANSFLPIAQASQPEQYTDQYNKINPTFRVPNATSDDDEYQRQLEGMYPGLSVSSIGSR